MENQLQHWVCWEQGRSSAQRGSGALQSRLLRGCERTSHLQVNRFPPTSKISVSEGCGSRDAARNRLSQKVPGSLADPQQLGPPANSRERNNQQKQSDVFLVEGPTEQGRARDQQPHAVKCSSQCTNKVYPGSRHCESGHGTQGWDTQEGRKG